MGVIICNQISDDNFFDSVIEIGKIYLSEDELWEIVITYDLYNEMKNIELKVIVEKIDYEKENGKSISILAKNSRNEYDINADRVKKIPIYKD